MAEEKKDTPKTSNSSVSWEEVLLLILGIIALIFVFIPRFFPTDNITDPSKIQSENINTSFTYTDNNDLIRTKISKYVTCHLILLQKITIVRYR